MGSWEVIRAYNNLGDATYNRGAQKGAFYSGLGKTIAGGLDAYTARQRQDAMRAEDRDFDMQRLREADRLDRQRESDAWSRSQLQQRADFDYATGKTSGPTVEHAPKTLGDSFFGAGHADMTIAPSAAAVAARYGRDETSQGREALARILEAYKPGQDPYSMGTGADRARAFPALGSMAESGRADRAYNEGVRRFDLSRGDELSRDAFNREMQYADMGLRSERQRTDLSSMSLHDALAQSADRRQGESHAADMWWQGQRGRDAIEASQRAYLTFPVQLQQMQTELEAKKEELKQLRDAPARAAKLAQAKQLESAQGALARMIQAMQVDTDKGALASGAAEIQSLMHQINTYRRELGLAPAPAPEAPAAPGMPPAAPMSGGPNPADFGLPGR